MYNRLYCYCRSCRMSAMDNEDGAMDGGPDEKLSPPDVLYADIDADSQAPTQIESLCVNCGQNVSISNHLQPYLVISLSCLLIKT